MTWREPPSNPERLDDDEGGGEPDTADDEMAGPDAPEPVIDDDI